MNRKTKSLNKWLILVLTLFGFVALPLKAENDSNSYPFNKDRYILPELDLQVKLTDRAEKQLKDMGERVKIRLYVFYQPSDQGSDPHKKITKEEHFLSFITKRELILPLTGGSAFLSEWEVPQIKNKTFEPILLVNVISARDKCSNNLLACSIYHDPYPKKKRENISLTCDVIHDVPQRD